MNLIVDIGNTRLKAALFKGRNLSFQKAYANIQELTADVDFIGQVQNAIISSVIHLEPKAVPFLDSCKKFIYFDSTTKIPLKNLYKSVSTLGSDRLAAAIGANTLFPSKNLLVIDTGTCLKYNFINKANEYLGGAISPGLQMRFKALNNYTDKLPLLEGNDDFNRLIGTTTNDSILSGVINGIICETDGVIEEYKKLFPDLTILVSGGDTPFFAKRLKNRIFAYPHLVLQGLNEILILNS